MSVFAVVSTSKVKDYFLGVRFTPKTDLNLQLQILAFEFKSPKNFQFSDKHKNQLRMNSKAQLHFFRKKIQNTVMELKIVFASFNV